MTGINPQETLLPGQSVTRSVDLNLWALIHSPRHYQVVGQYNSKSQESRSEPIWLTIQPRPDHDLTAYIHALHTQLTPSLPYEERQNIIKRLMYTGDARIEPILLEELYMSPAWGWDTNAFLYYLPERTETRRAAFAIARQRGLVSGMKTLLGHYGATAADLYPIIERSLAPDNPQGWAAGALAAQVYTHDAFIPRLIAIATAPFSEGRLQAIAALAHHPTPASMATLKALLDDLDASTREFAARAIQTPFLYSGRTQRRPLQDDDFIERLRRSAISD